MIKLTKLFRYGILFLLLQTSLPISGIHAQCTPVINNVYDTICGGDTLYGYYASGVYQDTFSLGGGCDSIRILNLAVTARTGDAPAPAWFNTGTNGNGGTLSAGSNDLNWEWSYSLNGTYTPAFVMQNPPSSYVSSPWPDCAWIAHSASGGHSGNVDFFYKIDFELPCFDACGNAFNSDSAFCLSLDFYADNSVYEIYVNGIPQSPDLGGVIPVSNPYGYVGYQNPNAASVSLCKGWKSGYNSLIIKISSGGPYEAFLAQASVNIPTPKPIVSDFELTSGAGMGDVDSGCAPYTVQFKNHSTGANQYIWNFGDGSAESNSVDPDHTYTQSGTYTVSLYAYNDTLCATPDTGYMTITVLDKTFRNTRQTDTASCFSTQLNLKANDLSGSDYVWNDNSTGSQRIVSASGTYWVKYQTPHCTFHTDTFDVWLPKGIVPDWNSSKSCEGDQNGSAWIIPAASDPNHYHFYWRAEEDTTVLSTSDSLNNVPAGNYTVQLVSDKGCDTVVKVYILEEKERNISFVPNDSIICTGDMISFRNTSDPAILNYNWDFGDQGTSILKNPTHAYDAWGTYRVMLFDAGSKCKDTAFATVIVDTPVSGISFSMDTDHICTGMKILFTPHVDSATLNIAWNFGDGNSFTSSSKLQQQHAYDRPGAMPVTLTAHFRACPPVPFTDTITVSPFPKVDLGPDSTLCLHDAPILLFNKAANPPGVYGYKWNTGDTTEILRVAHPGEYRLTVTGKGCVTTETMVVRKDCYIDIPNAFTPNSDGTNDYFFPRSLLSKDVTQFRLQIFNRWGGKVFETIKTDGRGWDGTLNNKPQPQGVYVYIAEVEYYGHQAEKYQGNVTLIR